MLYHILVDDLSLLGLKCKLKIQLLTLQLGSLAYLDARRYAAMQPLPLSPPYPINQVPAK